MAQKIKKIILSLTILLASALPIVAGTAYAGTDTGGGDTGASAPATAATNPTNNPANATDEACKKFLDPGTGEPTKDSRQCENDTPDACKTIDNSTPDGETKYQDCLTQNALLPATNPLVKDINTIVAFLSAGVGIVVTATIILGGIQYSLAGDKADDVAKAKKRMIDGAIALIIFLFIFAFVQWIIPGGLFS